MELTESSGAYEFTPNEKPEVQDPLQGEFCLQRLILAGDVERVEQYLREGVSANPLTIRWKNLRSRRYDWYPLIWAVTSGYVEMVELLIQHGADVNFEGVIVTKANYPMVLFLLFIFGAELLNTDMYELSIRGPIDVLVARLQASTCCCPAGAAQDRRGPASSWRVPHFQCGEGGQDIQRAEYWHEVALDWLTCSEPLMYTAIRRQDVSMVRLVLEHGASGNAPVNWDGIGYLCVAVYEKRPSIVDLLLHYGADANAKTNIRSTTPLIAAARASRNSVEMGQLLLDRGAQFDSHETHEESGNQSALQAAIIKNNIDFVRLLLLSGVNVNADAVLGLAANVQNVAIVETLLCHGAIADIIFKNVTPLIYAVEKQNEDMAHLLFRHGASPHVRVFGPPSTGREPQISLSAMQHAFAHGASPRMLLILQGLDSEPELRQSTPFAISAAPLAEKVAKIDLDEAKSTVLPWATQVEDPSSKKLKQTLSLTTMQATPSNRALAVSSDELRIKWLLCDRDLRMKKQTTACWCEWLLLTDTSRDNGGTVLSRGKTDWFQLGVSSPSTWLSDWHSQTFSLHQSSRETKRGTPSEKRSQGVNHSLLACKLRFHVKIPSSVPLMSHTVGSAWFPLKHLDVTAAPGFSAPFLTSIWCKGTPVGTLAFELVY